MRTVIALIGRPNVGKSTLFNFLTQSRDALVADFPGLTRDRKYGLCNRYSRSCVVVDTGGIVSDDQEIDQRMQTQTDYAIEEAQIVLFMVDAHDGLTPEDLRIVNMLRKRNISYVLVVNKIDGVNAEIAAGDFYQVGAPKLFTIAANKGQGVESMLEELFSELPQSEENDELIDDGATIRIAVVGRPNAGKSTLINALIKEDRLVTSAVPGTTRDSIRVPFEFNGRAFTLIDTAGVRRKSRVREAVEKFSIVQTLDAIGAAHVVIFITDITEGLADQDSTLLEIVLREGRALVLALNKTDDADQDDYFNLTYKLDTRYRYLDYVDKIKISASKKIGLKKLMQSVITAYLSASVDLTTAELNKLLERAVNDNQPPLVQGRRIKLRYMHQGGSHPPTFVLYGTQTSKLPKSYIRYLENFFREKLNLVGTPIRFLLRSPENPYAGKKNTLTSRQQRKRERLLKHQK
ncbi:MAG: ribosome biogenesis GTPase Der, partial [Pseudomonadota bacterium]